jgi:glycogen operon protein
MLLGGDELGRSQRGNNNAYCQDNEISWFNWKEPDPELLAYVTALMAFRRRHPVFRRRRFFQGRPIHGTRIGDICWYRPDGQEMSDEDWQVGFAKSLGVFLNGKALEDLDERGERLVDDSFYLMFNAHHEPIEFRLPAPVGGPWRTLLDTDRPEPIRDPEPPARNGGDAAPADAPAVPAGATVRVAARSLRLLRKNA